MKNSSSESLRRVLRHLKPYTGWIVLALLCAAGNVAATLYIPILVGDAVDAIVGPGLRVRARLDLSGASRPCDWPCRPFCKKAPHKLRPKRNPPVKPGVLPMRA